MFQDLILARQAEETLRQLRIVSNPHISEPAEQRAFVDQLMAQRNYYRGIYDDKPELDRKGLNQLKNILGNTKGSKIAVK